MGTRTFAKCENWSDDISSKVLQRLSEIKEELHRMSIALETKDEELNLFRERQSETEDELLMASTLTDLEKDLIETQLAEKLLGYRKTETKLAPETENIHKKLEEIIPQESADVTSSSQRCNPQGCEHKQNYTQMEEYYKKQLNEARSETAKKEEELKSVKDSLAAQVEASLKTGDTESMNNPVSKTRLTEMYDKLKLLQWPKVKDQLKSRKMNPKEAKDLIQKTFGNASDEIKRRRRQIEEMFQQSESSSGPTPQKVKDYLQLTFQNLQMALFHTNKEELLKTGFPECSGEFPEEVKVDLRPLTSECYWLSCLMALNNPPHQPDWENHASSMDPWDIFPQNIKPSVM